MSWPRFLVEELAERRCVLFVGNGVTMSCSTQEGEKPASWRDLLEDLAKKLVDDSEASREIELQLGKDNYLEAAEIIARYSLSEDRERILKAKLDKNFAPSKWIEICRDLDQNFLVTTNYDCILEDACPKQGFRTHVHEESAAIKVVRSPERLILKIHGCIRRTPGQLILSRSDYHWLQEKAPHALHLLEAILTTHTAVFVGYSLMDPDIQLILRNIRIAFPYAQPHVMLVEDRLHTALKNSLESSFNVRLVTYPAGDHDAGLRIFEELYDDVESHRASLHVKS